MTPQNAPFRLTGAVTASCLCAAWMFGSMGCASSGKHMTDKEMLRAKYQSDLSELAFQQADQDYRVGNLTNAFDNSQKAIEHNPKEPKYFILHGKVEIEMGKLDDALADFRKAIALNADQADAYYYSGLVYQRWSNLPDAYTAYNTAFEKEKDNPDYLTAAAEMLISMRKLDDASALLTSHQKTFEHNASVRRLLGHVALLENKPDEAADHFHQAMLLAPEDKTLQEMLVTAYFKAGKYADAEYQLTSLLKDPSYADRHDLELLHAKCLASMGKLVDARSTYLKLVEEDPSNPQVWYELGSIAFKLGDMRRVENVISRTMSAWPDHYEGYVLRGLVEEKNGDLDQALKDYAHACILAPKNPDVLILKGLVLEKLGRHDEATNTFASARMMSPQNRTVKELGALADVSP